jgi:membrane-associated phospholipid phosphatase
MSNFSKPYFLVALALVAAMTGLLGGPQRSIDVEALQWLALIRDSSPHLTSFVAILTQLGSAYATLGLGFAASLWLLWRRQRNKAFLLAVAVAGERLVMDGLKLAIGRPRPPLEDIAATPQSSSFPSGHSGNSMAVFVSIALIAAPPAWRRPAVMFAMLMSALVGLTRPYLGVHWPSDVIGGWAVGLMVAGIIFAWGQRSGAIEAQHEVV